MSRLFLLGIKQIDIITIRSGKNKIGLMGIITTLLGLLLSSTFASMSYAQTILPSSPEAIASSTTRTFTDDTGFAIDIPPGWVVQDYNNTSAQDREVERRIGYVVLAMICREDEALPAIGGGLSCEDATSPVIVFRYRGFSAEPEFSAVQNITADDFFAYDLQQKQRERDYSNLQIVSQNNTIPIIISSKDVNTGQQTNQTINGKLVTVTFSRLGISGGVEDGLYFVTDNGTTAYKISSDRPFSQTPEVLPDYIQQIMTSAKLVVPPSSPSSQEQLAE
jgi:hypothetical protein